MHVLFYKPLPYFEGLLVWMRATNVPNFSQIGRQISELLRVKILTPNNLLTDSSIFLKNIINCKYGPKVSLGTIFNPIGEGHL